MQHNTGLNDEESEESIKLFIETIASRLDEGEREDLASQLPAELQDVALEPNQDASSENSDFIRQFSELKDVEEGKARNYIIGAWQALKAALAPGEIDDIRAQLPKNLTSFLH